MSAMRVVFGVTLKLFVISFSVFMSFNQFRLVSHYLFIWIFAYCFCIHIHSPSASGSFS